MEYLIESHLKNCLKINITGQMDKQTILAAMDELIHHPDFYEKHSLWDLTTAQMALSLQDLKEIAGVMKLFKPEKPDFANKSAFLVSGRMNLAMANIFITLATLLPFEYKAFSDLEKARDYLRA